MNWTIFDGTTMFYTKQRLGALEQQGAELTKAVIQNVISQIAIEFYTVALEQIRLELLYQNIALSEDRMDIAKNKYEFGKASKMEYLQAQVDLNRDISNHMIQQEVLASSKTTLNELLGRDVTLDFFVAFDPDLNKDLAYQDLHQSMLSINPELLAVKYDMNAAKLVEKELFGQRIPEIGVNLGYNYSKIEAQAGFLLNRKSDGLNYGISARWNVFDGSNLNRQIQNARIVAQNSELNFESVKLSLERELYSSFISYQNNIQLHSMEQSNRSVAQENNEIAIERYRVGNSSPLELREAQINLLEANLRQLNAAYAVKTGEIDLLFLSGMIME
jgi:outer membrane protein TolC